MKNDRYLLKIKIHFHLKFLTAAFTKAPKIVLVVLKKQKVILPQLLFRQSQIK